MSRLTDENGLPTVAGAQARFAAIDEARANRAWREDVAARSAARHPPPYSWRRRSLTDEREETIALGRRGGTPTSDLLLVVTTTHDRRRLYALNGHELPAALDFEEVPVGDPGVTDEALQSIEEKLQWDTRDGWELDRLWSGHPRPLPARLW